jgi:hypothetical protein
LRLTLDKNATAAFALINIEITLQTRVVENIKDDAAIFDLKVWGFVKALDPVRSFTFSNGPNELSHGRARPFISIIEAIGSKYVSFDVFESSIVHDDVATSALELAHAATLRR